MRALHFACNFDISVICVCFHHSKYLVRLGSQLSAAANVFSVVPSTLPIYVLSNIFGPSHTHTHFRLAVCHGPDDLFVYTFGNAYSMGSHATILFPIESRQKISIHFYWHCDRARSAFFGLFAIRWIVCLRANGPSNWYGGGTRGEA